MNNPPANTWVPEEIDFDSFYKGEPPMPGAPMGFDTVPWDIGEAQPLVTRLAEAGRLRDDVLDVGCGLGENALFLAGRGYRVTGVDGAATALERARASAVERGLDVEFIQADVTTLDGVRPGFGAVLDSALYHCLGQQERSAYAAAVHRVTQPDAQLHLFAFTDTTSGGFGLPNQVSQEDLHTHLGAHWDIQGIELTHYLGAFDREFFEQRRNAMAEMGAEIDTEEMEFDEQGRLLIPVWYLNAVRKPD